MKLGCPVWQNRISPVLDTAEHFMIVSAEKSGSMRSDIVDLGGMVMPGRVRRIIEAGVDVVICGAVSQEMRRFLETAGIRVIPWVSGDVNQVLNAFLSGAPELDEFSMPGWRGRCRRWRHRRGERTGRKVMKG